MRGRDEKSLNKYSVEAFKEHFIWIGQEERICCEISSRIERGTDCCVIWLIIEVILSRQFGVERFYWIRWIQWKRNI